MFNRSNQILFVTAASAALLSAPAFAQSGQVDEIIVTGVAQATTVFDSSASVTAVTPDEIRNLAPRSINELFRSLPGIKAEDTGGDANANIKVRGLPITSGGSRYLSLQENGIPMLLVGDTAFATADSWLRFDNTVGSVQSIRGGSSATQAPNAVGGIVNLISKKPTENGGSVAATLGLDYESYRLDAEYGGVLENDMYYHIGGFVRTGEGVRQVEGNQEEGYQVKATVGKDFDRGSFALHFKRLDDRVPTFLPMPFVVESGGDLGSIGLDIGDGTNSLGLTDYAVRQDGSISEDTEGFQAKMTSIGFETDFALNDSFTVAAKGRYADISGSFYSPFPFDVTQNAAGNYDIGYALFNTETSNNNNLFGDVNIAGDFDFIQLRGGIEYATQNSQQSWNFNEARATLTDGVLITNGAAGSFTNPTDGSFINGYRAGNPAFGFCCTRAYDFEIEQFAPYLSANIDLEKLSIEASYRRSENTVTGAFNETSTNRPFDLNGDGTIASNEQQVQFPNVGAALNPVDYDANYDAFSVGANYSVSDQFALFANYSEGASISSPDRSTGSLSGTGVLSGPDDAFLNFVDAFEIGARFKNNYGNFSLVYFNAKIDEAGQFEVTTQTVLQNSFDNSGFEFEGDFSLDSGFGIRGNATYTDAEITGPVGNANIGNTPRRQADFIYNVNPYYQVDQYDVGLNLFGTTKAPAQDSNLFDLPAYTTVGAYINYRVREDLTVSVNGNNLFNAEGFTEAEGDGFVTGDLVRFRPINGRTISATLRYDF